MPRGDKSSYTDRQQRMAEHIEEGYENRGVSEGEAERRAWATVTKRLTEGRRAVRAAVKLKTTPPPAKVESLEVRRLLAVQRRCVPHLRRRLPAPVKSAPLEISHERGNDPLH